MKVLRHRQRKTAEAQNQLTELSCPPFAFACGRLEFHLAISILRMAAHLAHTLAKL